MKLGEYFKHWRSAGDRTAALKTRLSELHAQAPVPVFWLFGKTQTGKTSIIKYLTGVADAEIGAGFKPTTRFSRQYDFPSEEAPLLTFLDTRGLDEPGYESTEDIQRFHELAHVVIVTVRVIDHAQERVLTHLERIRKDRPDRPILLALTCLHDAYPQQQHPLPYPFTQENLAADVHPEGVSENLWRSLAEQRRRFEGLVDRVVPIDFTQPGEGFNEANYGGEFLKATLLELLPAAYRQTLLNMEGLQAEMKDWQAKRVHPYILGYSTLAATAGAFPVPWIDLLILPAIQTRMVQHLAELHGQPLAARKFLELAGSLGTGLLVRQAVRELAKFIPGVGAIAAGTLAGSSTYALGKAFCHYYTTVHSGHLPQPEEIKRVFQEQLHAAERHWKPPVPEPSPPAGESGPLPTSAGTPS